ncbi:MAG: ABC transporter ATP-binding protein [Lachnospiraceae bacterium]|nr:ABC transporter ATP-binding protein [Lachnospiraceae bacterium]
MSENILEVKNVVRAFPVSGSEDFIAVNDVSISVPKGSLTILRGRSGSGKTTLINMLGALDYPTKGEILFEGEDITKWNDNKREKLRREKIGFVFQSVSLIPMMTALENVEFALRMAGVKEGRKKRAEECLKMVGLGGRMNHMPQEMSGGEQQRVAIARAVAHKPSIIFADEPTAELDSNTAISVVNLFKEMIEKEGVTFVMTTHDTSLMGAGDKVFQLEDGKLIN